MEKFICSCHSVNFKTKNNLKDHLNYHKNIIKRNEYGKKRYWANRDEALKDNKLYRLSHKEKIKEIMAKWYEENPNYHKKYYEVNKEKCMVAEKKFRNTIQGKKIRKISDHNRRIKEKVGSKLTLEKLAGVYKKCTDKAGNYICVCCFNPIIKGEEELEHDIPISRLEEFPNFDLNSVVNLGLVHSKCNKNKATMTLDEWFKEHFYLLERKNNVY